uniref:Uncharacterized protein n=1 Tax=Siphoviridae sp. ctGkF2 TaxID=2827823 RepID=A0A8S5TME4_9CAUD|nr:MAG TPA: hypothetical protein [Siphoviridae sp. ctGkF2]
MFRASTTLSTFSTKNFRGLTSRNGITTLRSVTLLLVSRLRRRCARCWRRWGFPGSTLTL